MLTDERRRAINLDQGVSGLVARLFLFGGRMAVLRNQQFQLSLAGVIGVLLTTYLGATTQEVVGVEAVIGALLMSTLVEGDIRGLRSRRLLTAVCGLASVVAMGRLGAPNNIWITVDALIAVLINAYAIRDMAEPLSQRRQATE